LYRRSRSEQGLSLHSGTLIRRAGNRLGSILQRPADILDVIYKVLFCIVTDGPAVPSWSDLVLAITIERRSSLDRSLFPSRLGRNQAAAPHIPDVSLRRYGFCRDARSPSLGFHVMEGQTITPGHNGVLIDIVPCSFYSSRTIRAVRHPPVTPAAPGEYQA
jgi:hypothetical protein